MIVVNAPAAISEWIRTYLVNPSTLAKNKNEIQMYFPMGGQNLLAVLSCLDFSFNGFSRTLKVYPMGKTMCGANQAGNCILAAYFEFGFAKDSRLSNAVILPNPYWSLLKNRRIKNVYGFASQIILAAKFLAAVADNKATAERLNISVKKDKEGDEFSEAWDQLAIDNFMEDLLGESDFDITEYDN